MIRLDTLHTPITKEQEHVQELQDALDNVQGNILRGHGRKRAVHLFLRFQPGKQAQVRAQIRRLATHGMITSALKQQEQSKNWPSVPHSLFCSFFLSAEGYGYLNAKLLKGFSREFQGGMQGARARWQDPAEAWAQAEPYDFHAMVLLAQANLRMLRQAVRNIREYFASVLADSPTEEWGKAMQVNRKPVEHFGFADNISQPLFFQKDVEKHTSAGGRHAWDPGAGPGLVLVRDPHGGAQACGSYLVFLKLEQNVQGFAQHILHLADHLGLGAAGAEIVRAYVMGRFQDGTPVSLQGTAGMQGDLNDFSFFASDRDGTRCPYQAHIRKVNPRDDTASSRERLIVRRGITYGERKKEPKDHPSLEEMPRDGVGLLFMCYQRDIKKQFEALQFLQANNPNFFQDNTGIDPLIGRRRGGQPQPKWPAAWGAPRGEHRPCNFESFVTIKGGEYFFAPSMSFLKNL